MRSIELTLNGTRVRATVEPHETLLSVLRQRLAASGYEPAARNSPDDFARFIQADTAKWVALVEQTKMKGQ